MKRIINTSLGQRIAMIGVIALIVVSTCCAPSAPVSKVVPDVAVPNTMDLMYMEVTPEVARVSIEMYSPSVEIAICLTGEVKGDSLLVINGYTIPEVTSASDSAMTFDCDKGDDFIGILHTHPRVKNPYEVCLPSFIDQQLWTTQPEMLVQIVMCGSGQLWFQVRDGRVWFARWR